MTPCSPRRAGPLLVVLVIKEVVTVVWASGLVWGIDFWGIWSGSPPQGPEATLLAAIPVSLICVLRLICRPCHHLELF